MNLNSNINIHEIGPRDGFQNVKEFIPTERKMEIIEGLIAAGFDTMQLGSFVSPKAIPQMRDAGEIVQYILQKYGERQFSALVPNYRGAQSACQAGLRRITYVLSVSEAHNKANVGKTLDESWQELDQVRQNFPDMEVKLDLATVFSCPFDGVVPLDAVVRQIKRAVSQGIERICLCDTMGSANPRQTEQYLSVIKAEFPRVVFLVHFHDTQGMGMANCVVSANLGYDAFETSLAGLGGCPFAPGAAGNLATEDLVNMFESMGVNTGVNLDTLIQTAQIVKHHIEPHPTGRLVNRGSACK